MHGVDVEGKQLGIDEELVELLGASSPLPVTYAGGVRSLVSQPAVCLGSDRQMAYRFDRLGRPISGSCKALLWRNQATLA